MNMADKLMREERDKVKLHEGEQNVVEAPKIQGAGRRQAC